MPQKIIIDGDPGIGDAVAIALALIDPDLDVVAITATGGTVSGLQASRNVQAIVELLDPPRLPRVGTSEVPATELDENFAAGLSDLAVLHGPTGLGDFRFPIADLHHPRESYKVMVDLVRDRPHDITLLTLGPLTNVAMAIERAPEFLGLLKGLVCLGGTVESPGDVTAVAEFNMYSNPEAARLVLSSPATKTLVPLDASSKVVLTFEQLDRLPLDNITPAGRLLGSLLPFAMRAHHQFLGVEGIRLHEVAALAAVSRPDLFSRGSLPIDVETRGELTRGMTVFDRRRVGRWRTNIDVLRDVEAQGVIDYVKQLLRQAE